MENRVQTCTHMPFNSVVSMNVFALRHTGYMNRRGCFSSAILCP